MPATLLFKHIHVCITNDLYNLNFIALDEKLTELDKLISKFWNNCQPRTLNEVLFPRGIDADQVGAVPLTVPGGQGPLLGAGEQFVAVTAVPRPPARTGRVGISWEKEVL